MSIFTNLELAERMFSEAFHDRNTAQASVDAALKVLKMREADMTVATSILNRAIDASLEG